MKTYRPELVMMKRILLSLVCLACLYQGNLESEENISESLYPQLNRAIIRLEHFEQIKQEGSTNIVARNVPDGTAFFVEYGGALFVVSARHVVEEPYDLHARVQCRNNKTGESEVILLTLPRSQWIYHSNNGDEDTNYVDVAVMKLPAIQENRSVKDFRYEPKDSKMHGKNQLPFEDPEPPAPILVFGFPADVGFTLLEQHPLGRSGIVSMRTGRKFIKLSAAKFAEERCCLIDTRVFPGNSGSPVINQMNFTDPQPKLLGLVIATNTNLDFAIMEPVSRIREILEQAKDAPAAGNWEPMKK